MKPIKPKKMPKALEALLQQCATHPIDHDLGLSRGRVRSILAALAYERQRWQESQEKLAERNLGLLALARKYGWPDVDKEIESARHANHVADHIAELEGVNSVARGTPAPDDHHVHLQVRGFHVEPRPIGEFTTQMGHNVTETPSGYIVTPYFQRAETEAVIPKPRKKLTAP